MNNTEADAERIERSKHDPNIPNIYFNGWGLSSTCADVIVSLDRNGNYVATINMSYEIAKSLSQALAHVVATIEAQTGVSILTTADVGKAFTRAQQEMKQ